MNEIKTIKLPHLSALIFFTVFGWSLFSAPAFAEPAPPIEEYYFFEFPELSRLGSYQLSWFFLRNNQIWANEKSLNLTSLEWPSWDIQQIPAILTPLRGSPVQLLIFDADSKLIEKIELAKPFNPELYSESSKVAPASYQYSRTELDGRVEITSPKFPWPQRRAISSCKSKLKQVENEYLETPYDLSKEETLALCIRSTEEFINDKEIQKQKYIMISLPRVKGRKNIQFVQALERSLSSAARKNNQVFLLHKSNKPEFEFELGLTQVEELPIAEVSQQKWVNNQGAQQILDKSSPKQIVYEASMPNAAVLKIYGYYSDRSSERRIISPKVSNSTIHLQFIEQTPRKSASVLMTETQEKEIRTGLLGWLRPWRFKTFANQNLLASGRGDKDSFISLPGLDIGYKLRTTDYSIYTSIDRSAVVVGSKLEVSEIKIGAARNVLSEDIKLRAGYHSYSLAGETTGSTRLGSVSAFSLGASLSQSFELWKGEIKGAVLFGNSQSFDSQFELGRLLSPKSHGSWYLGTFVGFSTYRGNIVNKLNVRELFTENRTRIGLMLGYHGGDNL